MGKELGVGGRQRETDEGWLGRGQGWTQVAQAGTQRRSRQGAAPGHREAGQTRGRARASDGLSRLEPKQNHKTHKAPRLKKQVSKPAPPSPPKQKAQSPKPPSQKPSCKKNPTACGAVTFYTPWPLPKSTCWQETIGPVQPSTAVLWWRPLTAVSVEGTVPSGFPC